MTMKLSLGAGRAACLILAALAQAACHAEDVTVRDAWVRATVPGQRATGAFMVLTSKSDAALVAVASPVAGVAEVHEMAMDGTVMRMRAVPKLALPAGQAVELKPGGYHLMLMDLRRPLAAGETVSLSLTLEAGGKPATVQVTATVRELTAGAGMKH